jgi:hypothetical protein
LAADFARGARVVFALAVCVRGALVARGLGVVVVVVACSAALDGGASVETAGACSGTCACSGAAAGSAAGSAAASAFALAVDVRGLAVDFAAPPAPRVRGVAAFAVGAPEEGVDSAAFVRAAVPRAADAAGFPAAVPRLVLWRGFVARGARATAGFFGSDPGFSPLASTSGMGFASGPSSGDISGSELMQPR